MKLNKTQTALGVAAVLAAGALAAPTASADARVEALEAQVNQMSQMLQEMQGELNRVRDAASRSASENTAKVQELDQWVASVKSAPAAEQAKDHTFSVRGGWYRFNQNRGDSVQTLGTGYGEDLLTSETDQDAFYYGGAIDFNVNNDLFGLMDHTSFALELGVEYTEIKDERRNGLNPALTLLSGGAVPANTQETVTVNMIRLSAAPKIKFMHGSKFRPWLIPVGLDMNIISPPSDAITVLNTGMQFGIGAEYEIWNGIVLGADSRYHHTFDDIDGVDTDGFTLGGSLGFKF
ncbi:porin family protein [Methylotuvimicrobium sp. KM2]|uniref:porin family protein n=1 Tax=Methylotuvimicrobium sp. KM2 TaxID=3133976 RepID=UPI003100CA26